MELGFGVNRGRKLSKGSGSGNAVRANRRPFSDKLPSAKRRAFSGYESGGNLSRTITPNKFDRKGGIQNGLQNQQARKTRVPAAIPLAVEGTAQRNAIERNGGTLCHTVARAKAGTQWPQ